MTDDQHGDRHPEGAAQGGGRWDPLPQGDYDDGATAFVQLPEGGIDALLETHESPLAAPGHGYTPPQITVTPATTGTDPAATGTWTMPAAPVDGTQWHVPDAHRQDPHQHDAHQEDPHQQDPYGTDAGYRQQDPYGAAGQQYGGDDRFTYRPGATGHWDFSEAAPDAEATAADGSAGSGAPGHDVTGQWSIPVAGGDLPDESGEFTASSLADQWGGTAPATLPGGAPAPWATQEVGQPWSASAPAPERPAQAEHAAEQPSGHPAEHLTEDAEGAAAAPESPAEPSAEPLPAPAAPDAESAPERAEESAPPAGTEPAESTDPQPQPEPEPQPEAESQPEPEPEPETEPAAEAPQEPAPGPAAEPTPESAPDAAAEPAFAAEPAPERAPDPASDADTAAPDPDTAAPAPDPAPAPVQEPAVSAGHHEEHPLASYVLRVNGTDRPVTDAWIGESLLYVLRERLGLAGAKDGCSQGECGACNVQVDGRLVASCVVPAATAAGSEVRTVEGLAADGRPSDVQRALARCGAVQCGFCVPGMAMTVHDLLEGNPAPTRLEARQALCGNLCRCSGYRGVLRAVEEVVAERQAHGAADAPDSADGHATSGGSGPSGTTGTDEPRIPHQAGPGAGGVHPSAYESPDAPGARAPHDQPHDQPHDHPHGETPYGQDGGHA
ncbi:(2Fe-2S)-binding protein [Streptomyces sp. HMX87]|uniref:(2Fe-2S)-binding protein n=1 Tax=Streptomyces sp. HMX87 TaxID=3390849 RepID=UPI003A8A6078